MAGPNDYLDIIDSMDAQQSQPLKTSLYTSADTNPDQEAGLVALSKKTGIPVEGLRLDNGAEARRRVATQGVEMLPAHAPATAAFLADPENARVAHDDIENLQMLEGHMRTGSSPQSTLSFGSKADQATATKARELLGVVSGALKASVPGFNEGLAETGRVAMEISGVSSALRGMSDLTGVEGFRDVANAPIVASKYWEARAEEQRAKTKPGTFGNYLGRAVESAGTSILAAPFGLAGENAALAMFAMSAPAGQDELVDKYGYSEFGAALLTIPKKAMEGLTEKFGLDALYKAGTPAVKRMTEFLFKDLFGEEANTVFNAVADRITIKPEMSWSDLGAQIVDTAIVTAMQGPIQGGVMRGSARGAESLFGAIDKIQTANKNAAIMEALGEGAQASKLRARLPEKFQEVVAKMTEGGPIENVYIPVERFTEYFQSKGLDPAKVAEDVLSEPRRYFEALATGSDVVIPLSEYAAKLAASEYHQELIQDTRFNPGDMTLRESEEFHKSEKDALGEELRKAAAGESSATSDQRVFEDVLGQLIGIGRERGTAEKEATLTAAVFRTLAERNGLDAMELYQKYNPKITRPLPDVLAQRVKVDTSIDPLLDRLRAGDIPSESSINGPSLGEFLREKGVVDEGGELAQLEVDGGLKPFQKKMVRKGGLALDKAREAAVEAGYLQEGATIRDLLDAVDGELRGTPVYTPGAGKEDLRELSMTLSQLQDYLDQRGVDVAATSNDEIRKILDSEKSDIEPGLFQTRAAAQVAELYQGGSFPLFIEIDGIPHPTMNSKGEPIARTEEGIRNFWRWFGDSRAVDALGRPQVLYHQTSKVNAEGIRTTGFDVSKIGARGTDEQMPDGIFLKPEPNDIGLNVTKEEVEQIPLYVRVESPAYFGDRNGLAAFLHSAEGYDEAAREVRRIDHETAEAYDRMEEEEKALEKKPEGRRSGFDEEFFERADALFAEGNARMRDAAAKAREIATTYLRSQDFDGVVVTGDAGSFGRKVNTFVVFDPNQLKSATENRGTFDPDDPRILYQGATGKLSDILDSLKKQLPDMKLDVFEGKETIEISRLVFPEEQRGKGQGSEVYKALTEYADATGKTITATPSTDFGGTKSRIIAFNKRFGFVENKGKNKDFAISDTMYRLPRKYQTYAEGNRGFLRFGANRQFEIGLLERADLSTFIHESGHFYLEVLGDLAADPASSEQTRADFDALLKWFGVEKREDIAVDQHEQFARAFEAYLMEGKAPSMELRGAFQRFKAWLVRIYQDVRNLNVPLNDEIRRVFDRLVASDEEIKRAESMQAYAPLFATAEEAGMSEAEFAAYRRVAEKANEEAKEKLEKKLMAELTREQDQWWKDERAKMKTEVETEAKENPVYEAFQVLTKGKTFAGEDMGTVKLSREALVKMYGEPFVKKLPRSFSYVYSKAEGLHPDAVAEMFGFTSGDEMVRQMAEAPPMKKYIEAETDVRMREKYGDMLNDGSIADQALEAIHTDQEGQLLRAELRAINRKRQEVKPFVDAAKEEERAKLEREKKERDYERRWMEAEQKLAVAIERGAAEEEIRKIREEIATAKEEEKAGRELLKKEITGEQWTRGEIGVPPLDFFRSTAAAIIGNQAVRRINPRLYSQAEAAAARKAVDFAARKKWAQAAEEKAKQLMNHYLYVEAVRAKEEADQVQEYMSRLSKKPAQERIGKAGADYLEQINAILERYEFKPVSLALIARRESLLEWVRSQEAQGLEVNIADEVLIDAGRQNYKTLTIDQLRAIRDAVKNIEHLAKLKNRLLGKHAAKAFNEARSELVASLDVNIGRGKPIPLDKETKSYLDRVEDRLSEFDVSLLKVEQFVEWADGGDIRGPWAQYIFEPLSEAQSKEGDLTLEYTAKVADIFERFAKEQGHDAMIEKRFISTIGQSMTHQALIAVALNTGNASNLDKLLRGYGWEDQPEVLEEILGFLDARDWQLVQEVWDTIETLWPEIAALEKRLTGLEPPKVQPREITNEHGTFRGGYYPVVYDSRFSTPGEKQADAKGEQLFGGNYVRATVEKGHTKARIEGAAYPINLSLEVIPQHIAQVVHDIAFREAIVQANRLINTGPVKAAVIQSMGQPYHRMLNLWLASVANDKNIDRTGAEFWTRFLSTLRTNATVVAMGFKATTMFAQIAGLSQSLEMVKGRYLTAALLRFAKNPAEAIRWVSEKSGEMRHRRNNVDRDIRDGIRKILGKHGAKQWIQSKAFLGVALFDAIVSVPTWIGAYDQAQAEGLNDEFSIAAADRAVRLSQGAGGAKDLSAVQRSGELMKNFTSFYSFFNVLYNRLRNMGHLKGIGQLSFADAAWKSLVMVMIPALLGEALAMRGPDDDEEWWQWALRKISVYPLMTIPLVRDVVNSMEGGRPYQLTPISRLGEMLVKLPGQIEAVADNKKDLEDLIFQTADLPGYAFGLPTGQAKVTGRYLWDVMTGDEEVGADFLKRLLFHKKEEGKK